MVSGSCEKSYFKILKPGDYLFNPIIGGGITAIEVKLLNRNLLCYDINLDAIKLTESYLDFEVENKAKIKFKYFDARKKKVKG